MATLWASLRDWCVQQLADRGSCMSLLSTIHDCVFISPEGLRLRQEAHVVLLYTSQDDEILILPLVL